MILGFLVVVGGFVSISVLLLVAALRVAIAKERRNDSESETG